jgi:Ca-activated chloride channel family protein
MKKTLLKLMLILTLFTTNIIAEDKPQAVIIFDASGSMWGQIDGVNKITIAKEALNKVVSEWNPNVELGLTVYGHRKKGDCSDIETVVPVSTVDKDKIISIIRKIQPKGKTPIARTLQKVAEELKFTEEKATIILISDGKESCDANPCAVAKNLEKRGIDFVTHVIGFNVDTKTDKQLECIAEATGGEYFSAKDATALNDAMKKIVKKVEKVEPTPTPKLTPEPTPKKLKKNLEITASEKEGGKWIDAYHYMYKDDEGKRGDGIKNISSTRKKAGKGKLPVGKYFLQSKYNEFEKLTAFEIKAGEVTKLNIVFGQTGEVETTASETNGGKWIDAYHYTYKDDEGKRGDGINNISSTKKKAGKGKLPVGKYFLQSKYNEFEKLTAFEIKAGEVTKLHVVFEQFRIETKCTDMNVNVSYEVYANSGRMVHDAKMICSKALQLSLDAGDYRVEATVGSEKKEEKFTIGKDSKKLIIDMTASETSTTK